MTYEWTYEREARLLELRAQGLSMGQIARDLETSRDSVAGRVRRMRERGKKVAASPRKFICTAIPQALRDAKRDPLREQFAEMMATDKHCGVVAHVAKAIGVSRTEGYRLFAEIRAGLGWQAS